MHLCLFDKHNCISMYALANNKSKTISRILSAKKKTKTISRIQKSSRSPQSFKLNLFFKNNYLNICTFLCLPKKKFILIFFLVLSIEIMELFQLDNLMAFLFFIRLLSGVVVCLCVRTHFPLPCMCVCF